MPKAVIVGWFNLNQIGPDGTALHIAPCGLAFYHRVHGI